MFGKRKKGLAISGGGSKGAFTGGILDCMYNHYHMDHHVYAGNSTGSLLQTLTSIHDFEDLREGYTTIELDDIYKTSPFRESETHKNPKINWWSLFKMLAIKGEPTFGDSTNLINTMKKFFPKEKLDEVKEKDKKLITTVTNLSKARTEYFSSDELSYEDFIYWTWVSTNAVPFSSLVKENGDYYADGGYTEHMPIQKLIDEGCDEIDAITTKPMFYDEDPNLKIKNVFQLIQQIIEVMLWETSKRDIEVSKLKSKDKKVKINIVYAPYKLTDNSMYFDKKVMERWWEEGKNYCKDSPSITYEISKNNRIRQIK